MVIYYLDPEVYKQVPKQPKKFTSAFQKQTPGYPTQPQQFANNQNPPGGPQFPPGQMHYQNQMPQNMQYNNQFGYGNQPNMQYNYYGDSHMHMGGGPNPMMNPPYQVPHQMPPQQQMYNYGYQNYQGGNYPSHMPVQQPPNPSGFGQNPYYGSQMNYGYNMQENMQPASNSPLWGSSGMPTQNQFTSSQFYPQYPNEGQFQGYDSMGYQQFPQNESMGFYNQQPMGTQGDPHPSVFKDSHQPPPKVRVRNDSDNQMRVGSWDPKFLQKGGIKKFYHNNGQSYKDGQIANWTNMKKGAGYAKVRKNKKGQNKKKAENKRKFDSQNLFSQTFGNEDQQKGFENVADQNQVPYLDYQNPPQTAKFNNFNQNIPKSKKGSESSPSNNPSAFRRPSFSDTFPMQGPLKSSRLPSKESLHGASPSSSKVKKSRSNNFDNDVIQEQAEAAEGLERKLCWYS